MAKNKKKPRWEKPKLLILVRGRPEELVLANCKQGTGGGGPNGGWHRCMQGGREPSCYAMCYMTAPS